MVFLSDVLKATRKKWTHCEEMKIRRTADSHCNTVESSAGTEDAAQLSSTWLICARTEIPVVIETGLTKVLSASSFQSALPNNCVYLMSPYFLSTFSYTFLHCGN